MSNKTRWVIAATRTTRSIKSRGLLRHGVEHLTEKQQAKLTRCLEEGDPSGEVDVARQCYQQLRSIYHAATSRGRQIAEKVIAGFPSCPIPQGRPARPNVEGLEDPGAGLLRHRRCLQQRHRSHQPNHRKVRRLAHGFRDFKHYRLRILLAASGQRSYRNPQNHA